jgi:hypothetical protein
MLELILIGSVDTACVYPEVVQAITQGSFAAELQLLKRGSLVFCCPIFYIGEDDFTVIGRPRMREYSVWWDIVHKLGQAEFAATEL